LADHRNASRGRLVENDFKDLFGEWDPGEGTRTPRGEPPAEIENRVPRALNEKEVKVLGVYERPGASVSGSGQTFVVLQDNRNRKVCIYIGRMEAIAISQTVEGEETERPLTYDLLMLIIEKLGGTVDRVIVDDIWQDTFYAKVSVNGKDGATFDIDCRPSDAINIALRARSPIYMAEAVIEASQIEI
jgi:uncharacterized protein